jgi:hypothetical protein
MGFAVARFAAKGLPGKKIGVVQMLVQTSFCSTFKEDLVLARANVPVQLVCKEPHSIAARELFLNSDCHGVEG